MNILRRFTGIVGGFFGKTADRLEDGSPEMMIADARRRIEKSREEAGKQLVEIQTWAEMARIEMKQTEVRLRDVRGKIRLAAQSRDRDLLTALFMQEEQLAQQYAEKKTLYENAQRQAVQVRDRFRQFEQEMNARLEELSAMRAQSRMVRLHEEMIRLDDRYGAVSGSGTVPSELQEGMDRLRRGLNERTARIQAVSVLREENPESRIRDLDYETARLRASGRAQQLLEGKVDTEYEQNRDGFD